jgi:hypothetical protein
MLGGSAVARAQCLIGSVGSTGNERSQCTIDLQRPAAGINRSPDRTLNPLFYHRLFGASANTLINLPLNYHCRRIANRCPVIGSPPSGTPALPVLLKYIAISKYIGHQSLTS